MSDVQALVDALASELDRPVGIDDHRFRAIAYSSHAEGVDRVRMDSILKREAPQEVISWLESLGLRDAGTYVRVAANEELAMSARVCLPVRFDGTLLGFLWLIDEPELSEAQLLESAQYAEELAVALYRARVLERESRERERLLVARLLGAAATEREAAAAELIGGGHLAPARSYLALLLSVHHEQGGQAPDPVRIRLVDATEQLRRTVAPHHLLALAEGEEVVVVLAAGPGKESGRRAGSLAELAAKSLAAHPGWEVRVGVGEECESLEALADSAAQAREAVRVARAIGRPGPVVPWSELGAYRTIAGLLDEHAPRRVPGSLQRLLAHDDAAALASTLERYLDLGGDASAAAAALYIHRSSLYGRLHRIEEIAGVDLRSGEDRLELHLGIRILRLSGAWPGADSG